MEFEIQGPSRVQGLLNGLELGGVGAGQVMEIELTGKCDYRLDYCSLNSLLTHSPTLPLQVPISPSASPIECSIELKIDGDITPLLFQFDLSIIAAKPVAWKILTSEKIADGERSLRFL